MAKWKKLSPEAKLALAGRLRRALARKKGISEKKMFGGTCFLLKGNMLAGTGSGDFLFRVGRQAHAAAVKRPGARPMVHGGRRMEGFVWVKAGTRNLAPWIRLAAAYVATLPPKKR